MKKKYLILPFFIFLFSNAQGSSSAQSARERLDDCLGKLSEYPLENPENSFYISAGSLPGQSRPALLLSAERNGVAGLYIFDALFTKFCPISPTLGEKTLGREKTRTLKLDIKARNDYFKDKSIIINFTRNRANPKQAKILIKGKHSKELEGSPIVCTDAQDKKSNALLYKALDWQLGNLPKVGATSLSLQGKVQDKEKNTKTKSKSDVIRDFIRSGEMQKITKKGVLNAFKACEDLSTFKLIMKGSIDGNPLQVIQTKTFEL